jgi:tRNA(fMet)-specific endonuclease VapC
MSNSYLLDTVAAVGLLNGNVDVVKLINEAIEIFIPIIAVGELYFGAENSGRVAENIEKVNGLTQQYAILYSDLETALEYGRIEFLLKRKGRSIPQNDKWIAAIARQNNLTVLTRDKHFNEVDGLLVQGW